MPVKYHATTTHMTHGDLPQSARFVGDDEDNYRTPQDIAALVASGDLFITLATELELASNQLSGNSAAVVDQLERLTANLLYLQRHYSVKPAQSNHRQ